MAAVELYVRYNKEMIHQYLKANTGRLRKIRRKEKDTLVACGLSLEFIDWVLGMWLKKD